MKKYNNLGELLQDYRKYHNLLQTELAALVDVDARTVSRWEKNETLAKPETARLMVEKLLIPHQVLHNLNSSHPIAVYFSLQNCTYSLSAIMSRPADASWFRLDMPVEDERIRLLDRDTDVEFVEDIQRINNNPKPLRPELVRETARLLPELNLILHDQSGFYAGHISVLPLKLMPYQRIRKREVEEGALKLTDLSAGFAQKPLVFYFYSMYADTLTNAYYLMNRLLSYFMEKKFRDYLFAGISYRKNKIEILREMGLKIIWQDKPARGREVGATFMEGNLDMFLFGKTV